MNIEWIEMMMNGAAVKRYHTVQIIGQETVAEHSFGVVMMVIALTEGKATNKLLKSALYHDLAEQITGDIPAPVKWQHPVLKTSLQIIEESFESTHSLQISLSEEEETVLKWADLLQLLLFCKSQRNIGNRNVNAIFARGVEATRSLPHHEKGSKLLNWLIETYSE